MARAIQHAAVWLTGQAALPGQAYRPRLGRSGQSQQSDHTQTQANAAKRQSLTLRGFHDGSLKRVVMLMSTRAQPVPNARRATFLSVYESISASSLPLTFSRAASPYPVP